MLLNLKPKANVYEQIVKEYEKLINIGALLKGERLPSCRALAREYGINPNTVERAYKELISLGYIESIPRKGFYVNSFDKNRLEYVKKEVIRLRDSKISKEELISIINSVYEEGFND